MVEDFCYDVSTEADAITALSAVMGPDLASVLWKVSTRSLNLKRPVESPTDLRRVAEHIMDLGDLARIGARSLLLRVITYEAVAHSSS